MNVNMNIITIMTGIYLLMIKTEEKNDGNPDTAVPDFPLLRIHFDCAANTCSFGFRDLNKFNISWSLFPVFIMLMEIKIDIRVPNAARKILAAGESLWTMTLIKSVEKSIIKLNLLANKYSRSFLSSS